LLLSACANVQFAPAIVSAPDQRESADEAVLVGAGDIAHCYLLPNAEATAALLDNIQGTVFTAGDNAYSRGTASEFRHCYGPTWGRHKERTRPSVGNHDYATDKAGPHYEYFGANAGPRGLGYYSYALGHWHIVVLNSNIPAGVGSEQLRWLAADLAANSKRCTLAYWHHPYISSVRPNGNPEMAGAFAALYRAGAEVVVNGHDHIYERYLPMNADVKPDPERGMRQFIVGTGGASMYPVKQKNIHPLSEVRVSSLGVIKFTLNKDSYTWEFITAPDAEVADKGSGNCH
jgi:acid phosphatase type 7